MATACVACCEDIKASARICPHCGTSQHPERWKEVGLVLKWVAGITAVLSLVGGSLQLNTLYQDWRKRELAIDGYVAAARMQHATGDLKGAHALLKRAEELDSLSTDVLDFQVDLIMEKLQEYYSSNRKADWVMTYKAYADATGLENYDWSNWTSKRDYLREMFDEEKASSKLALASVAAIDSRKAEIIAHMAWLDSLVGTNRESHHVESLYKRALEIDADNAYARIMYAAWLMEVYNFDENPKDRLTAAIDHMRQAKPTQENLRWFNAFSLKLLSLPDDAPEAYIEVLRIATKLDPSELSHTMASDSIKKLEQLLSNPKTIDRSTADRERNRLRETISDSELIHLMERLGIAAFGCNPWEFSCKPEINVSIAFDFFDAATALYEQTEQRDKATRASLMAWLARRRANYDSDEEVVAAMKRNLDAAGTPSIFVPTVAKVQREGSLKLGDLITHINGTRLHHSEDRWTLYKDNDEGETYTLTVIRDSATLSVELPRRPDRYVRLVDYVVPESLLVDGSAPALFNELHAAWTSD